ncbi:MAG: divergent polysaccharide deacetylase family protein [Caulobacterales bacterium]
MFAKRPPPVPVPPRRAVTPAGLVARLGPFGGPSAAAAAAAGFFVLCASMLIALTGDPKAGAPTVRLSLAHIADTSAPPGWREALPSETAGDAPFGVATVELSTTPLDAGPMHGQAIITIPADARVDGPMAVGAPLPQAPIAGLFAPGPGGPLPTIAADGRTPAQAYARPYSPTGKPKIALIIGGLGLNAKATRQAIETLPADVTLSFVPYADGLQGWIDMARAAGHEVLLETPMEPKDYPENDPGPYTLMADGRADDTTHRLEWLLSRATGYFGVTNYLGSKFVQSPTAMGVFSTDLRQRGLAFVDDGSAASQGGGLPRASASRIIDDQLSGDAIQAQLGALEAEAARSGRSLGSGFAYPVTLEMAAHWASTLSDRGYQLVPASALTVRR